MEEVNSSVEKPRLTVHDDVKLDEAWRGVFQCELLSQETCKELVAEVLNIKTCFPSAPLNSGTRCLTEKCEFTDLTVQMASY